MAKQGFSLMELMIVVAIIAVLSMVSVPSFMRFLAKAKRAEAYMNLHAIYAAEKSYWAENGRYSSVLIGKGGVGWKPEGQCYYTYGFPGAEGKNCFTGSLGTSASNLGKAHASDTGFLALAVGDIDGDGQPDILAVDHHNVITILNDDIAG